MTSRTVSGSSTAGDVTLTLTCLNLPSLACAVKMRGERVFGVSPFAAVSSGTVKSNETFPPVSLVTESPVFAPPSLETEIPTSQRVFRSNGSPKSSGMLSQSAE